MTGWSEARVRDGRASLEIKPTPKKKLEPITARLRKTIPLGKNKFFVPLGFADDGKTLLGYTEQGGAVVDVGMGRLDLRIPWPDEPKVLRVVLSADKRTMFVGRTGSRSEQLVKGGKTTTISHATGRLDAYDAATGRKLSTFEKRTPSSVFDIAVSADGRWLAFNERRGTIADVTNIPWQVVLWNLETNRSVDIGSYYGELVFSPDSKQLFFSTINKVPRTNCELLTWDLSTLNNSIAVERAPGILLTPAFSSDGRWYAIRPFDDQRHRVELRRRSDHRIVWRTTQKAKAYNFAEFDPKGRFLMLCDEEQRVRYLDLDTLKESKGFDLPPQSPLRHQQFSPDGTKVALLTHDLSNVNPRSMDPNSFDQPILWLVDLARPSEPERVVLPPNRSWQFVWTPDSKSVVVRALDCLWVLDATNIAATTR
jgi:WD40 repeat protein